MIDFDLHIHCAPYSTCATQTAEQAVLQAKDAGIKIISVCNHNTIDGLDEIKDICANNGMVLINGVELAVSVKGLSAELDLKVFHLLGYNFKPQKDVFNLALDDIRFKYKRRIIQICEYLRATGYSVEDCACMKDLRMQLLNKGYFVTEKSAKEFMKSDEMLERFPEEKLDSKNAIDLIHQLGGKVFWAHPNRVEGHKIITRQQILAVADRLCEQGLDGLEVFHPNTIAEHDTVDLLMSIVCEKGLKISLGSDTHHFKRDDAYFTKREELKSYSFDFDALRKSWEDIL